MRNAQGLRGLSKVYCSRVRAELIRRRHQPPARRPETYLELEAAFSMGIFRVGKLVGR